MSDDVRLSCSVPPPFFSTNLGVLCHMDAVDFLKRIPPASIHLVFADPPYNIKKAQWDTFVSQKHYIDWSMNWIREAARVLHPRGSLYICGFSEILADIKWAAAESFAGCKWLVWHYRNKANLGSDWGRSHESLLHFRKSQNFIFNRDAVRVRYNAHTLKYPLRSQAETSNFRGAKPIAAFSWSPHPQGAKPKDVFDIPTLSNGSWEKTPHPTQKPVELLRKIILASSDEGHWVLDPFGGSGTSFAVAEACNRRWCGAENNETYCTLIKNRLSDPAHIERIRRGDDEQRSQARRARLKNGA